MAPASKMQWQGRQRKRVLLILFFLMREECKESCPTLCDPIDGSPPGSPFPGILQARTLEWVAISFSNARKLKVKVKLLSRVRLLATPWTAAYQAPPSMGFARQEYWSVLPFRQHIKEQRHYFANKGPFCQSYGFSRNHVWM